MEYSEPTPSPLAIDATRVALSGYLQAAHSSSAPTYLIDAILRFLCEGSCDMIEAHEKCEALSSALSELCTEIETDIAG